MITCARMNDFSMIVHYGAFGGIKRHDNDNDKESALRDLLENNQIIQRKLYQFADDVEFRGSRSANAAQLRDFAQEIYWTDRAIRAKMRNEKTKVNYENVD